MVFQSPLRSAVRAKTSCWLETSTVGVGRAWGDSSHCRLYAAFVSVFFFLLRFDFDRRSLIAIILNLHRLFSFVYV
jgi:hypothetical protein